MLAITMADLRFRMRQFLIAVVGAGVVFALALLLTGMASGFANEIDRTVASAQADRWVLSEGTSGPFTSVRGFPQQTVAAVARTRGVTRANGMVISLQTASRGAAGLSRIMMIGAEVGAPSQISPSAGRAVHRPGEAVVDKRLHVGVGERFAIGTESFLVVGTVRGRTMLGGTPDVWISLQSAQAVLFGGRALVTSIVVDGSPTTLPAGLTSMSGAAVVKDSLGPMKDAVASVNNTRYLMWGVAVIIVAALVYVSALQRTRDFAVMKAVGASSRLLFLGVAIQAVLITMGAALFALSTAWAFKPLYKVPVEVPGSAYLVLPMVAVIVGVLSSLVALRRAVNVDPAIAFGSG